MRGSAPIRRELARGFGVCKHLPHHALLCNPQQGPFHSNTLDTSAPEGLEKTSPKNPILTPFFPLHTHTCLSRRRLPAEELVVEGAVRGVEARLQEHAAVGDRLQWGRALVGEPEANKELQGANPGDVS